jgi:NADH:ubiquinone reductase (non-electrogenic)
MSNSPARICILGGGFGGLYTALRLSQLPWEPQTAPQIVLIDQQDRFLFAPFLYELVTGEMQTWEVAPPFSELLAATSVRFLQAQITGLDPNQKQVYLQESGPLEYDQVVIALGGSQPAPPIPGLKERAFSFRSLTDVTRLKERLKALEQSGAEKIRVAIVGGGYSGVELACKLADRLGERGRLRLIERSDTVLSTSPEYNRLAALAALESKGVWIDYNTEIVSLGAEEMTLRFQGQEETLPVDLLLWTAGTGVSDLIRGLPLPHSDSERLPVNTYLQVQDHPDIYALGDGAVGVDASGQRVPSTAQVAFQQADYCAWNLWASLTGRPLLPFRYQALGEMLALGTDSAALSGLGVKLSGPLAAMARRLVYLYRFPTWEHQVTVGINWLAQPWLGSPSK